MASLLRKTISVVLANPVAFELQQKFANNYSAVGREFSEFLLKDGQRILDIGCSTATCAGQIVDMANNEYVGVDISAEYVALAKKRNPLGRFEAMDARKMSFADASFDLAMFVGVMHHMDDALVKDCLADVRRVLKPEGRALVAEPVFTPGKHFSNFLLSLDRGEYIRDDAGYRSLFDGYDVERHRYFPFSAHRFSSYILAPKRLA